MSRSISVRLPPERRAIAQRTRQCPEAASLIDLWGRFAAHRGTGAAPPVVIPQ
jgi:hypothetical protein